MISHIWRVLLVVLMTVAAGCSDGGESDSREATPTAAAEVASNAQPTNDTDAWLRRWREKTFAGKDINRLWDQFEQAARAELSSAGADHSDLQAKADLLGKDPQRVFETMRDEIGFEPYGGVLRGARGTLLAGAGNALDRALLAQDLLKRQGTSSRIVAGTLTDAQVEKLLSTFLLSGDVPTPLVEFLNARGATEEPAGSPNGIGLTKDSTDARLRYARDRGQRFWAATDATRTRQFDLLDSQLRNGHVKTELDVASLIARLRERIRRHFWLQIQAPDGSWRAFDPSFPDAEFGVSYAAESSILAEVPEDAFHRLEFRLVYMTLSDGAPSEEVLLSDTIRSADALFLPVEFRIQPADMTVDSDAMSAMNDQQRIDLLRAFTKFQGVLRNGNNITAGRFFDLSGGTYDDASPLLPISGGTFVDAFGGGEESTPQFLELRVTMRLVGPDREPVSQARTLVRSRDTLAPTFAPPLLEWDFLLQPQWVPGDFTALSALTQVLAMGNALRNSNGDTRSATVIDDASSASLLLLELALLRQDATADILLSHKGVTAFIDEPLLTISEHRLTGIDPELNLIKHKRTIDIVSNAIRYVTATGTPASAAFDAALQQGIADSSIEDGLLQAEYIDADLLSGTTVFDRARAESRPVLLAKTQDIDALRASGVTESNIEWIYDNESPTARLLVATTTDGSNAWWSIQPDGNTILRGEGGQGLSLAEFKLLNAKVAMGVLCMFEAAVIQHRNGLYGDPNAWRNAMVFCTITSSIAGVSFVGGLYAHGWHYFSYALMGLEYVLALRGISGAH